MRRIHKAEGNVVFGGVPLNNSFNFKYLGFEYQANGCWRHAVNVRMVLARTRFDKMYHIWNSTQLSLEVKLQLYESAVVLVLVYGCKAWKLTSSLLRSLNRWNSHCTSIITGRSIREEATEHHLVRSLVDSPHLGLLDGLLRSASNLAPWRTVAAPCVVRLEVLMALV